MAENIEIKARASDWKDRLKSAQKLYAGSEELIQEDTFFKCRNGRLKLRDLGKRKAGYLIFYKREDRSGPKTSVFETSPVPDPVSMRKLLSKALGRGKTVKKRRTVLFAGQSRIHFDDVEGLGKFIEIEVCLKKRQDRREGEAIARDLMSRLAIKECDLLEGAYSDMLL